MSLSILVVADFFHPVRGLSIELFLNRDVRHGRRWRGTVPMLLARRETDDIARANFLDRSAPSPRTAGARRHDERLTQRVGVPCGACTGLERHARADGACRIGRFEQGIYAHRAGEIL